MRTTFCFMMKNPVLSSILEEAQVDLIVDDEGYIVSGTEDDEPLFYIYDDVSIDSFDGVDFIKWFCNVLRELQYLPDRIRRHNGIGVDKAIKEIEERSDEIIENMSMFISVYWSFDYENYQTTTELINGEYKVTIEMLPEDEGQDEEYLF